MNTSNAFKTSNFKQKIFEKLFISFGSGEEILHFFLIQTCIYDKYGDG